MLQKTFYAIAFIVTANLFCSYEPTTLYKIFDLTHVPYEKNLESINTAAQKNFLRKAGLERWEMETKFDEQRAELLPLLQKIGLIDQRIPQKGSYDYALFMGALGSTMEKRKIFLEKLIKDGIFFKEIIILAGERPLDAQNETEYFPHAQTEADAAEYLFKDFQKPYTIIRTPMLKDQNGKAYRPTTEDTVKTWLTTNPHPGTVLVISSNPFTQRQINVTTASLPKSFSVEGAGPAASERTTIAVYLDELARTLYSMTKNH